MLWRESLRHRNIFRDQNNFFHRHLWNKRKLTNCLLNFNKCQAQKGFMKINQLQMKVIRRAHFSWHYCFLYWICDISSKIIFLFHTIDGVAAKFFIIIRDLFIIGYLKIIKKPINTFIIENSWSSNYWFYVNLNSTKQNDWNF